MFWIQAKLLGYTIILVHTLQVLFSPFVEASNDLEQNHIEQFELLNFNLDLKDLMSERLAGRIPYFKEPIKRVPYNEKLH